MKRVFVLFYIVFLLLFMSNITQKPYKVYGESVSEIVMDADTNRILFENNAFEKKPMASTTKILTAICVIENCDMSEKVVISKKTTNIEGSSIYLEEGEVLTVEDLLYGLMLRSGNDCAETLATHVCGCIENFTNLMNKTADKIGAKNSNFTNPHGLHDDNHYTTAYDLALISSYAIKNTKFKEICSTKKKIIPFTTQNINRLLINKNKLLNTLDGATGIKTGYTKKAGRCLVSSINRDGHELVCVVLNCPSMFERSIELLENANSTFFHKKVIESDNILGFIDIKNTNEKIGYCVKKDIYLPLKEEEIDNIDIKIDIPDYLLQKAIKDTNIGKILFYYKNNLIFSEKIYTI